MASQSSEQTVNNKVPVNPFGHFFRGNKNLFQTNPLAAILAALVASAVAFGTSLLFITLIASRFSNLSLATNTGDRSTLIRFLLQFLIVWAVTTLITGYFYEVVQRAVLTGTRRQKVSFGALFPFVGKRYVLTVIMALIIGGAFIGWFLILALLGAIAPALGVLAGLAGLVFLLIFIFRMIYSFLVVIDDEQPQSPVWVMRRSAALWKQSGGAIVCYFLLLLVLAIVFSLLSPTDTQNTTSFTTGSFTTQINSSSVISYGALVAVSLIEGLFILIVSAPLGEIYNQAKQIVDRK